MGGKIESIVPGMIATNLLSRVKTVVPGTRSSDPKMQWGYGYGGGHEERSHLQLLFTVVFS